MEEFEDTPQILRPDYFSLSVSLLGWWQMLISPAIPLDLVQTAPLDPARLLGSLRGSWVAGQAEPGVSYVGPDGTRPPIQAHSLGRRPKMKLGEHGGQWRPATPPQFCLPAPAQ